MEHCVSYIHNRCFVSCAFYVEEMRCVLAILTGSHKGKDFHSYYLKYFLTRYFKVLYLIDIDLFLICHRYEETEISGMQPSIVRLKQENTPKTRVGICSNCLPGSRRQLYAFLITIVTHNAL